MDHDHREHELKEESRERIERERARVAEIESSQPLRRPVLSEFGRFGVRDLGIDDLVASERLAETPRVEIMVALVALEDDCCLCSGVVGGETRWQLTAWGECELGRHRAFGAPAMPPAPPTHEEIKAFLEEALDGALFTLLPSRGPVEAADRLRAIAREAHKEELDLLAARAESALAGLV